MVAMALADVTGADCLTILAVLIVLFVLGTSLEIVVVCRRFVTWITRSLRGVDDLGEVPKHYTYRRGSVSHSWREASLEPILSHTSEYDALSSEYDKHANSTATARVTEAYSSRSSLVDRPIYTSTPPSSPGPSPRRIHTPCHELVPERATRGQAHATVAAAYGEKYGEFGREPVEVSDDIIEEEIVQRSFAAPPLKKPPPTLPKPQKKKQREANGTASSHQHHTDHQISYHNISKKVTQESDKFWLIFSGEYTKAMDQDWHSGHFCCWNCDLNLTGHRYILREEHPYCIKCYENLFANTCEECKTPIGTDSKDLSYKDKHWHEKCFKCVDCTNSLVDQPFSSREQKLYCADCHDNNFAARCDGCTNIFKAGMKKFEYKGKQWHEQCFCCSVCKQPIGNKSFIPRDQEVVCVPCYEENFAQRCLKCNGVINKGGITYKGSPWHKDCFTCTNCNKTLSGEKFTSREDKPYCADCFGELFAKKCIKCTKAITGLGGTKFISFEERHWHSDCFMCYRCNCSLVGRGFLTDGDDILCPECGRA